MLSTTFTADRAARRNLSPSGYYVPKAPAQAPVYTGPAVEIARFPSLPVWAAEQGLAGSPREHVSAYCAARRSWTFRRVTSINTTAVVVEAQAAPVQTEQAASVPAPAPAAEAPKAKRARKPQPEKVYTVKLANVKVGDVRAIVEGGDKDYTVQIVAGRAFCSCPDATYRRAGQGDDVCRHVKRVRQELAQLVSAAA